MTTLLITGSYPPDVCGVGDYSYCLMNANNSKDWKLFYKKDWRLKNYHRYKREIAGISPDKIIIQYPSQGYGWSLLPFILMIHFTRKLGKNCILVYHEFSNRSKKAKFVENIALFFCKKLIVSISISTTLCFCISYSFSSFFCCRIYIYKINISNSYFWWIHSFKHNISFFILLSIYDIINSK